MAFEDVSLTDETLYRSAIMRISGIRGYSGALTVPEVCSEPMDDKTTTLGTFEV